MSPGAHLLVIDPSRSARLHRNRRRLTSGGTIPFRPEREADRSGPHMSPSWFIWLIGAAVLLAAGFAATLVPRLRARDRQRRVAWSTARAAIDSASVSRDAAVARVVEAERLLARAESIAADHGGPRAARTATEHADRADRLWRESGHG